MTRYFCTYFDSNYLLRGLVLYRSLRRHCPDFKLWVLCLDEAVFQELDRMHLPGIELIPLTDFEAGDEPLRAAKANRSRVEYYFTCTPSLPLYVLKRFPDVDLMVYLDSDLFFFSGMEDLFARLGDYSIAMMGHRFPPRLRSREKFGLYNVGWLAFRRDENGLACLNWWRERCLEWCYDRLEGNRFADQKYLDEWPDRFDKVVVLDDPGANLAPWNLDGHEVEFQDGQCRVNGRPLIFYHFQGVQMIRPGLVDIGLWSYLTHPSPTVLEHIYRPYIEALKAESADGLPLGLRRTDWKTQLKLAAGLFLVHLRCGDLFGKWSYRLDEKTRVLI